MKTTLAEETHADSCGSKGIGETPQGIARGGSPAARGKRHVFPERRNTPNLNLKLSSQFMENAKVKKL
ncbi:hypothetical protein [Lentibacillus persicus]|uniref:hypothetical protein n=1 Tax=Lentibacillus persicus TaxID=640948 RepID=UPI001FE1F2C1|nr:hypothetical protein [Lentibacillus persicus]